MMTPPRLLGTRSITHHVIVVGDPRTQPGIVTFELANLEKEVGYEITRSPAATVDPGNRVIGFTRKSDEEIERYGKPIMSSLHLFENDLTLVWSSCYMD